MSKRKESECGLFGRWEKTGNCDLIGACWRVVRSNCGMCGLESDGKALKQVH